MESPLIRAVKEKNTDILKYITYIGGKSEEKTALLYAIENNDEKSVKILAPYEVSISNFVEKNTGNIINALDYAISLSTSDNIIEALRDSFANNMAIQDWFVAARYPRTSIIDSRNLIYDKFINENVSKFSGSKDYTNAFDKSNSGYTALMYASCNGNYEITEKLASYPAELKATNKQNKNTLDLTMEVYTYLSICKGIQNIENHSTETENNELSYKVESKETLENLQKCISILKNKGLKSSFSNEKITSNKFLELSETVSTLLSQRSYGSEIQDKIIELTKSTNDLMEKYSTLFLNVEKLTTLLNNNDSSLKLLNEKYTDMDLRLKNLTNKLLADTTINPNESIQINDLGINEIDDNCIFSELKKKGCPTRQESLRQNILYEISSTLKEMEKLDPDSLELKLLLSIKNKNFDEANYKEIIDLADLKNRTPLMYATIFNCDKALLYFINKDICKTDEYEITSLMYSIIFNNYRATKQLLKYESKFCSSKLGGITSLMLSIILKNTVADKLLLSQENSIKDNKGNDSIIYRRFFSQ